MIHIIYKQWSIYKLVWTQLFRLKLQSAQLQLNYFNSFLFENCSTIVTKKLTKTLECLKSWKSDTNWYKRKIQAIIESECPNSSLKTNEILRAMHWEYGKICLIPTRSCNYSAQRFKWYWRFDGKVQWVKPNQNPAAHTYVRQTEMLSSWVYSLPILWYRMLFLWSSQFFFSPISVNASEHCER